MVTMLVPDSCGSVSAQPLIRHQALPTSDLEMVLDASADDLSRFRGGRMLLTGATGFLGSWLLDTLLFADRRLGLDLEVQVLVRDVGRLAPHLREDPRVKPILGDVRTFTTTGHFDAVVHGAASSSAARGSRDADAMTMVTTILDGTHRALEAAAPSGDIPFLFISSGAVYGSWEPNSGMIVETGSTGPGIGDPEAGYAEAKRMAEVMCNIAVVQEGAGCTTARCFSFVGPRLPLDVHFAAGNFVGDVLRGRPVRVLGDGTTVRSYLYAADLAVWIWRILSHGKAGRAYNVGSEHGLSMLELARIAADLAGPDHPVEVLGRRDEHHAHGNPHYVPSTARARHELGLQETISTADGLGRTFQWYRSMTGMP